MLWISWEFFPLNNKFVIMMTERQEKATPPLVVLFLFWLIILFLKAFRNLGSVLALHVVNPGSITDTSYGSQSLPWEIPEHWARSKPQHYHMCFPLIPSPQKTKQGYVSQDDLLPCHPNSSQKNIWTGQQKEELLFCCTMLLSTLVILVPLEII